MPQPLTHRPLLAVGGCLRPAAYPRPSVSGGKPVLSPVRALVRWAADDHRRVLRVVGVAVVLGVVLLVGVGGWGGASRDAADVLAGRLARRSEPSRYSFEYRSGGTMALDCVVPNRRFSGSVDLDTGAMAITVEGSDRPGVIVDGQRAWVRGSLLAPGLVPTPWLSLDSGTPGELRSAVHQAMGADLGPYVAPGALAPSGNETVAAALEVASDVGSLGRERIGRAEVDGFRLSLDPERYAEAAGSSLGPGRSEGAGVPALDVWVDDQGFVRRVEVRATDPDGAGRERPELRWTVDYDDVQVDLPAPPGGSQVTSVSEIDASRIAPAPGEPCELGLGS